MLLGLGWKLGKNSWIKKEKTRGFEEQHSEVEWASYYDERIFEPIGRRKTKAFCDGINKDTKNFQHTNEGCKNVIETSVDIDQVWRDDIFCIFMYFPLNWIGMRRRSMWKLNYQCQIEVYVQMTVINCESNMIGRYGTDVNGIALIPLHFSTNAMWDRYILYRYWIIHLIK